MDSECRDHSGLILQILASIRTIDARVDELSDFVKNRYVKNSVEYKIKKRIVSLLDTRMKLVYSLLDIGGSLKDTKMNYKNIKRHRLFK